MDVVHGWHEVPSHLKGASLAIGNFDGVMVFEPYPRKFFQPQRPFFRLSSLPRKLELLSACGCGFTAVIPFNETVAELTAADFVEKILVDAFAIKRATVGYNFFFGKGRGGNPAVLAEAGRRHGFDVSVIEPQGQAGEIFSSTRVRELLAEGDVAAAAEILGYWWRISGLVESGAGRGQGLGFPTANVRLEAEVMLKHGIYAVHAYCGGKKLQGAAYLGTRPTFDAGLPLLETFLFDFDGNLYGKTLEVEFIAFVREDAKFRSAESLSAQMAADCAKAKAILDSA